MFAGHGKKIRLIHLELICLRKFHRDREYISIFLNKINAIKVICEQCLHLGYTGNAIKVFLKQEYFDHTISANSHPGRI